MTWELYLHLFNSFPSSCASTLFGPHLHLLFRHQSPITWQGCPQIHNVWTGIDSGLAHFHGKRISTRLYDWRMSDVVVFIYGFYAWLSNIACWKQVYICTTSLLAAGVSLLSLTARLSNSRNRNVTFYDISFFSRYVYGASGLFFFELLVFYFPFLSKNASELLLKRWCHSFVRFLPMKTEDHSSSRCTG